MTALSIFLILLSSATIALVDLFFLLGSLAARILEAAVDKFGCDPLTLAEIAMSNHWIIKQTFLIIVVYNFQIHRDPFTSGLTCFDKN